MEESRIGRVKRASAIPFNLRIVPNGVYRLSNALYVPCGVFMRPLIVHAFSEPLRHLDKTKMARGSAMLAIKNPDELEGA